MTDRQITHAPGCWAWGPRHYECAVREIELLVAEWKRVAAARGEAEDRAERLAEALRDAREFVAEALSDERAKFAGYEAVSGIAGIEATLQKIDAALAQEARND